MKNWIYKALYFPGLLSLLWSAAACEKTAAPSGINAGSSHICLTVTPYASGINTDSVGWEDRVDELRMIVFSTGDGSVVFNEKLYFPNGFDHSSRAVKLNPGTYDFLFIANEGVYAGDFVQALLELDNRTELDTDARFRSLPYRPDFVPDGTGASGRFVMSALYEEITVSAGGTETNPVSLDLPTGQVELIRALAKVEVIFRKRESGSAVAAGTIGTVHLSRVAAYLSVPPLDDYYTGELTSTADAVTADFQYDRDSIGAVVFYIPELLNPEGSAEYTALNIDGGSFPIRTLDGAAGMALQRREVPSFSPYSVVRNYHYIINAYLNASGGVEIETVVKSWQSERHVYIFDGDFSFVIPPVIPTDSSLIIGSDCGRVELHRNIENLTQGLYGAYHDQIDWNNDVIIRGNPRITASKNTERDGG
ncbi:MAG: FimB/Mfa2 family fimbrial subunit [Rikenellaceae bacterium]|nr:FimB/Mfa2 family fimbrial subunit [Rikenellaceae bacterium]